jgi:hypothetical protein
MNALVAEIKLMLTLNTNLPTSSHTCVSDQRCIPLDKKCNNDFDCKDMSDEVGCKSLLTYDNMLLNNGQPVVKIVVTFFIQRNTSLI